MKFMRFATWVGSTLCHGKIVCIEANFDQSWHIRLILNRPTFKISNIDSLTTPRFAGSENRSSVQVAPLDTVSQLKDDKHKGLRLERHHGRRGLVGA